MNATALKSRPETPAAGAERPLLLILCGAPGAGKTSFYESKLRESFPIQLKASVSPLEQAEIEQQRKRLLKEAKSFVYQSLAVDPKLVDIARSSGFEVRAIFIATEHPDLNTARVLSRASRGGLFGPVAEIREEYQKGLRELPAVKEAVDELILVDNTAEGRSPRVVAQFVNGEIVKLARSIPEWTQRTFGKDISLLMAKGGQKERIR